MALWGYEWVFHGDTANRLIWYLAVSENGLDAVYSNYDKEHYDEPVDGMGYPIFRQTHVWVNSKPVCAMNIKKPWDVGNHNSRKQKNLKHWRNCENTRHNEGKLWKGATHGTPPEETFEPGWRRSLDCSGSSGAWILANNPAGFEHQSGLM